MPDSTGKSPQLQPAEDALLNSRAQLAGIIASAMDAIITVDEDQRIILFNTAAERMFHCSVEDALGQSLDQFIPERFRRAHKRHIQAFSQTGITNRRMGKPGALWGLRTDGQEFPFEASISQVEAGGQKLLTIILRDITEKLQAEKSLQASEARYRAIVEDQTELISRHKTDGTLLFVNEAYCRFFGKSREELIGSNFFEFLYEEDKQAVQEKLLRLRPENPIETEEHREITPDGRFHWLQWKTRGIFDEAGELIELQAVGRDITDRKQAEEALRESEQRLELALKGANLALWDWNVATDELTVNERWAKLLGYTLDEVVPQGRSWDERLHPEDEPQVMKILDAHLDGKTPSYEAEYRLRTKSGEWKWILDRGRIVERDKEGRPLRVTGTHLDITERKRLEEQLIQAQKMEAIGRLAGGVAHDFNNILTIINGICALVLTQLDESGLRQDIEQIKRAGERAASLTHQLLAFSRKQILQPQIINLNTLLVDLDKMLRRLIGEDVHLVTVLAEDLGQTTADPGQIEQVILNLAINARDAMPAGGQLTLETANVYLDEVYTDGHIDVKPGPYVMLAITDTGFGMDAETKARIFEPFFTTKEMGKGTGLGLSTVHGIINQSGGHIWVYSEPGQGTTFKMYLPQIGLNDELPQPDQHHANVTPGAETILLVEDEEMVRKLIRRTLEGEGYTVFEASYGPEAIQACQQQAGQVDLLLTDVILPGGISGPELAAQLKMQYPALKVLCMSGYTDNAIIHHGVLDPGVAFLQKPFRPAELLCKVREVLDTALE